MDQKNEKSSDEEINFENPNLLKFKDSLNAKTKILKNSNDLKPDLNQAICDDEAFKKLESDLNLDKLNEQLKNLELKIKNKESNKLPEGWEEYQDDVGAYYWHITSGTIQREFPIENCDIIEKNDSIFYLENEVDDENESSKLLQPFNEINKEQSFLVYSLGSMDFDEHKLTAELSSKAIQKCIVELTTKGDNNAVRCYGSYGTKKLILKIENQIIKFYDIPTKKILHIQPISSIRVWGVNGNNDFAYVANVESSKHPINKIDQLTSNKNSNDINSAEVSPQTSPLKTKSNLKCHIFHCEEKLNNSKLINNDDYGNEAQLIANLLKEEFIKYKLSQNENLADERSTSPASSTSLDLSIFLDEPVRTVIANYLGSMIVDKPVGIDVINRAIELVAAERGNNPIVSLVHISPANIIVENTNTSENALECKLCRLSFLGISQNNTKQSAFIIQNEDDRFEAHVFECRPSSASLCKFIQEACRVRFEKCEEAHKRTESVLIRNGNSKASVLKEGIAKAFSKITSLKK